MAAKTYTMTEEKRLQWQREGRGQGEGGDYRPWLTTTDVFSTGHKHRTKERHHERMLHLLSSVEHECALYFDYSPTVLGIKDQFPLPIDETRAIARDLGIQHPTDTKTRVELTITTDLVLSVATSAGNIVLARSCKDINSFGDFNEMEHAEIERRWWLEHATDWKFASNHPAFLHLLPPK